jgi:hypothetical protein
MVTLQICLYYPFAPQVVSAVDYAIVVDIVVCLIKLRR